MISGHFQKTSLCLIQPSLALPFRWRHTPPHTPPAYLQETKLSPFLN